MFPNGFGICICKLGFNEKVKTSPLKRAYPGQFCDISVSCIQHRYSILVLAMKLLGRFLRCLHQGAGSISQRRGLQTFPQHRTCRVVSGKFRQGSRKGGVRFHFYCFVTKPVCQNIIFVLPVTTMEFDCAVWRFSAAEPLNPALFPIACLCCNFKVSYQSCRNICWLEVGLEVQNFRLAKRLV